MGQLEAPEPEVYPAGQERQAAVPAALYCPAEHDKHTELLVALVVLDRVPALQA